MTFAEVIEALDTFKNCYDDSFRDAEPEAYDVIVELIEKQISEIPVRDMYKLRISCPTCGADLFDDMYNHHCTCGQALDWSEE